MFCGKSEELIRRLRRAEIAGQRALIVKPLIDDRYDVGHVVSHAGAKMRAVTAQSSDEVRRLAQGYDAVGIDEVQFFDHGIVEAIDALVAGGARVVAAGLAQDFRGADPALRRGVRRQARSCLPSLRRPGDDDATARRRRTGAVRRRDDPGRGARFLRGPLPCVPFREPTGVARRS
jgi:hypothetical protein